MQLKVIWFWLKQYWRAVSLSSSFSGNEETFQLYSSINYESKWQNILGFLANTLGSSSMSLNPKNPIYFPIEGCSAWRCLSTAAGLLWSYWCSSVDLKFWHCNCGTSGHAWMERCSERWWGTLQHCQSNLKRGIREAKVQQSETAIQHQLLTVTSWGWRTSRWGIRWKLWTTGKLRGLVMSLHGSWRCAQLSWLVFYQHF